METKTPVSNLSLWILELMFVPLICISPHQLIFGIQQSLRLCTDHRTHLTHKDKQQQDRRHSKYTLPYLQQVKSTAMLAAL